MISFPVCPSHHELLQATYGNWYSVSLARGRPSKILVEPNISNPSSGEFRKKEAKKNKSRNVVIAERKCFIKNEPLDWLLQEVRGLAETILLLSQFG